MLRTILVFFLSLVLVLGASHSVTVGKVGIVFKPDTIIAAPGDKVHFIYYPGDHGVAEGAYNSPCHPKKNGFWSGFIDTKSRPANKIFTITINDTKPIFIYCPNSDLHCQFGMSMVINPGHGQTLETFRIRAPLTKSKVPPKVQGGRFSTHN